MLEAYALELRDGAVASHHAPERSSEHALVFATILATLFAGYVPNRENHGTLLGDEAMSLLAQTETDDERWDERWREVRWSLRYAMAIRYLHEGRYAQTAASLGTLLHELEEGQFKPWPYTDEARYHWQSQIYVWLHWCAISSANMRKRSV